MKIGPISNFAMAVFAQDWVDEHPILFGVGLFLSIWVLVCVLISFIGGWSTLSRRFRYSGTFKDYQWSFQSAQMRFIGGYRNSLKLGASHEGLFMSTILPFRIAHPPLLIPWEQITVDWGPHFLGVKLILGRDPSIPLWINETLAKNLKRAAGASWPDEV